MKRPITRKVTARAERRLFRRNEQDPGVPVGSAMIQLRFVGRCCRCSETLRPGAVAVWWKGGRVAHPECVAAEVGQ